MAKLQKNLRKSPLLVENFSFWANLTVFLLITAMAANFYRYIVALPLMAVLFGITICRAASPQCFQVLV